MCGAGRTGLTRARGRRPAAGLARLAFVALALVGCTVDGEDRDHGVSVPDRPGAVKTAADERAGRRLFDGAPPVIPHERFPSPCISCHDQRGIDVPGTGFSPPSPHVETAGLSAISRCEQCHVRPRSSVGPWRANSFAGLRQDLRAGRRLSDVAPPVVPHPFFMRENCQACHSGPAAREEIRTTHPERQHCQQCHLEQRARLAWARATTDPPENR